MSRIFGIPADVYLGALAAAAGIMVLGLLFAAWRNGILLRIGLRNVPRRPLRTALVTIGLALSTAVLTSALATGDTMTYNIRSLVNGTVGRVDELIVLYRREPQRVGPQDIVAIVTGQLISGSRAYFDEGEYRRLARSVANEPAIAGLVPAIVEPMVAANPASQQVGSHLNVIGLPDSVPAVFGEFRDAQGVAYTLDALADDEVLLNSIAAIVLEARAGDPIRLFFGPDRPEYVIKAVVETPGLGADQPALVLPLARLQTRLKQDGKINRILVANAGDAIESVDRTQDAVIALRAVLVRDDVARRMHEVLRTDVARRELEKASAQLTGAPKAKVELLAQAAQEPAVTPAFKSLLGDPEIIGRIAFVAFALRGTPAGTTINEQLRGLTGLTVIDLKRAALERAEEYGAVVTSIFLVVGLLSILAALALVFLVFVLLAAERRGEMGVARAIGMRRGQLILTFLYEGMAYDLAGALAGVAIGVVAGGFAVQVVSGLLSAYGVTATPYVTPRSLGIAYLGGVVLTFLTVGGAAWRVSRLNIVSAIRDLPAPPDGGLMQALAHPPILAWRLIRWPFRRQGYRPSLRDLGGAVIGLVWALTKRGPLVILAGYYLRELGLRIREWTVFQTGVTAVVLGVTLLAAWIVVKWPPLRRLAHLAGATALILFWLEEYDFGRLGFWPLADPPFAAYALRGFVIVACGVWFVCVALPVLPVLSRIILEPFSSILPAVRLAVSQPASRPWRTALAMSMFAQVVFTMTLAAVLLNVALYAYGDPEKATPGYDIRGEPATSGTPPDVLGGLATAAAIKDSDFAAIGTLLSTPGEVISLSDAQASWRAASVYLVDEQFVAGIPLRLTAWSSRYGDGEEAWRAFASQPGLALMSAKGGQTGSVFTPSIVWVRDPRGGSPTRLEVIGLIDSSAGVPAGVVVRSGALGQVAAEVSQYYFKVSPGVRVEDAALGLTLSFGDSGLKTQIVGQEARRAAAIRGVLTYLLEVFLGLGLIAGLAALGILGVMAVVERRANIGVLRAIGYRRRLIVLAFILESGVIAGFGTLIGVAGGLAIARAITVELATNRPEVRWVVPYPELGLIIAVTLVASLLTAALPARQAGQVSPAEAIRN